MSTQLFINAHIATGMPGSTAAETAAIQDILVEDGKFISIAPNLKATLEAQDKDMASVEVVDLGGKLVCPPFCDTHLHLDYVFTARKPGAVNESGTLFEGIQRWSETKADLTVDEIKERAKIGIAKEMRHGVQFIRSHADVTDPNLTSLKALLELKEELKDTVTLQIVSFPQEGMYSYEGPHGESGADLVEQGLKMGADCVGGIPHFEQCREFGERSMHTVSNWLRSTTSSSTCIATKPTIQTHVILNCCPHSPIAPVSVRRPRQVTLAPWDRPTMPISSI